MHHFHTLDSAQYAIDFESVHVTTCACTPIPVLLVQHGVFPTSPTRPQTGVSIELLDIYCALFEHSCDAIMALAAALRTIYKRRGFCVLSKQTPGALATDPFCEGLGNAVLWFSNLQDRIRVKARSPGCVSRVLPSPLPLPPQPSTPPPPQPSAQSPPTGLTPGRANRVLRERCPACFGLNEWGRPLVDGGDVQFGADGCFSYWHVRSAGDGPISHDPQYFISQDKVNKVRERIAKARKKPPARFKAPIPQAAVDACNQSWDAANENKKKADPKQYDSSGIFAMTCRHSQVLFLCDIDTPRERQEYIVACLEEVNSHLPPQATVLQAYDVGCVAYNSFNKFSILSEGLRPRVDFVINTMHAYGHQWICQLIYSPRLRRRAGLSDHEGVERIWSRIRKLIPLTRHQWKSRRIWTLDQYIAFVNDEGCDSLGTWIERQRKNLTKKQGGALKVLQDCQIPESELRLQWQAQKEAQTSVQSYAPTRLRHELEKIIALQTQIDGVENSIAEAKTSITSAGASTQSLALLKSLEATHETLSSQAEVLYTSLNLHGMFPELKDLPLEFVTTLVLMDNLKKSIRQRVVGSFLEWESLRRAVKGRREAPGTKMYQATSKAIAKCEPALLRSVAKFNGYCAALEDLRPTTCDIPIPPPLATDLTGLRNDPYLQQDVWMALSGGAPPRWLSDENVRDGIRSLHVADRCAEEAVQLNVERRNLRTWLDQELAIVAYAMISAVSPASTPAATLTPVSAASTADASTAAASHVPASTAFRISDNILQGDAPTTVVLSTEPRISRSATRPTVTVEVELAVEDIFEGGEMGGDDFVASEELDPGVESDDEVLYVGEVLRNMSCDAEDETSAITAQPVDYEIQWDCLVWNQFFEPIDRTSHYDHIVVGTEGRPKQTIAVADLARLQHPTALLNGFCMNGVAAAMLEWFTQNTDPTAAGIAHRCAVLSTYDLPRVRYNCCDAELWRALVPTKYWEKSVWIVPVHRLTEKHWMLIIVVPHEEALYFFDSMNGRNWHPDLRVRETAWVARPLRSLVRLSFLFLHITLIDIIQAHAPLQTNSYDCGLWVLCTMATVMRGHALPAITEADMADVRELFKDLVLTLPTS
ncbi:hypothetical protein DFH07DRAFT_759343 [Mycena maculata]|uniref:Ubiquitin-like protease family profile domain-containing protein n=1 Tax=Mycena maculata TaxID=230809 RepID=A0AAD7MMQ3_9AGAR|nr:hypothetical protein DFH07DRAFT_759343 [Mycena maculata]